MTHDPQENGRSRIADDQIVGRTPSDAVVEITRDVALLLGRTAPFFIIAGLAVFGVFKFVELEQGKLQAVQDARLEAMSENREEIRDLKDQILADASKITALQSANVDAIVSQIAAQREIVVMISEQTSEIAKLTAQVMERRRELDEQLARSAKLEARNVELEEKAARLDEYTRRLDRTERVTSDILAVLRTETEFVPTSNLWQIAERYEGGEPGHVGEDYAGNYYYGAFRILGENIEQFVEFAGQHDSFVRNALSSAGGAEAAARGDFEFRRQWENLAERESFLQLQRDFMAQEYRQVLTKCRLRFSFDAGKHSIAFQSALWSATVQHGPDAAGDFCKDLKTFETLEAPGERALIKRLYELRHAALRRDFAEQDPIINRLLRLRYELEENDAYKILGTFEGGE